MKFMHKLRGKRDAGDAGGGCVEASAGNGKVFQEGDVEGPKSDGYENGERRRETMRTGAQRSPPSVQGRAIVNLLARERERQLTQWRERLLTSQERRQTSQTTREWRI